jgi:uracil phosphoribosyltransferase
MSYSNIISNYNNNKYYNNSNFFCLTDHPLVSHKVTLLRDKTTNPKDFREILEEVTFILASESAKHISTCSKKVETPISTYQGIKIQPTAIFPVIRAGLGMIPPLLKLLPDTKLGFIGLSRNEETLKPEEYYSNIPEISQNTTAFILDPMLATGNTINHSIAKLSKMKNIQKIIILSILSTTKALDNIFSHNKDVIIYSAGFDTHLTKEGFITPGLGDAGDRIFNTIN